MSALARRWVSSALALLVAASGAWGATTPVPATERTLLRCEAVYMPARETWVREVELVGQGGRLNEVRIDDQAVYTFAVRDTVVLTSQDNERIQIDFAAHTWRSDFRGLASSQGRCELLAP